MKNVVILFFFVCIFCWVNTASALGPYTDNGSTIYDQTTGLTWLQSTADVNGDNTISSDNYPVGDRATWQEALAYCENLELPANGDTDWRLPNIRELKGLVDRTTASPSINVIYFQCSAADYWSSTTVDNHTEGAWHVSFHNGEDNSNGKANHDFVRCVRGGILGGAIGYDNFVFETIPSPVENNTCFPVRVKAYTGSGILDTVFSGDVSLAVNYGDVSPLTLTFTNGIASDNCVKIYEDGYNKQLSASGLGRSGASNYFSTTDVGTCSGNAMFYVNEPGTTVILYDMSGTEVAQQTSLQDYISLDVPCGSYTAKVEKDLVYKGNIPVNITPDGYVQYISLPSGTKPTAVVLVPGILGSTNVWNIGMYPSFTRPFPDTNLTIHAPNLTGWNELQWHLEGLGYDVILSPWDWRNERKESMDRSVRQFLIPAIEEAKRASGSDKVYIVAHSMGGLLTRAYIQSDYYQDDVEKVALVAVPNLGSVNPYFMWNGGDLKTTTEIIGGNFIGKHVKFYENTIKRLWKKAYNKKHWKSCNAPDIRTFLYNYGPGVLQLMSTEKFLLKNGTYHPVNVNGNVNTFLKSLNEGSNRFKDPEEVFASTDGDKVHARVFYGKGHSTLSSITVGDPAGMGLYADGKPYAAGALNCKDTIEPREIGIGWGDGDGTVPKGSALYPWSAGWAGLESTSGDMEHGRIMHDFRSEIAGFLDGTRSPASSSSAEKSLNISTQSTTTITPGLYFSVIGSARILVTDNQGRMSGFTADTHEVLKEIPNSQISAGDGGESVTINNPTVGTYLLTYFGSAERDFSLYVTSYNADGDAVEKVLKGFKPDSTQTMVITYDSTTEEQFSVQPVVHAPQDFEYESYACSTGQCTKLTWTASEDTGVSYIVYRTLTREPFYTEFTRLPAGSTSYNTEEAWDDTKGLPVNAYAVSAIKVDNTESFFAEEALDTGYCFPWPMFFPAIIGDQQ